MNKNLEGPKPVAYYANFWSRLTWKKVYVEGTFYSGSQYWEAYWQDQHVADFFYGKSGRWFGVVFERTTIWGPDKRHVLNMLAGLVIGPQV